MKKGVVIGIGIVIAIAITGIVGFNTYVVNESGKVPGIGNNLPITPSPTHGRNLTVNLTENVGIGAH